MKDTSGNENKIIILHDISSNLTINPIFLPLQDCSNNKKNFYINHINIHKLEKGIKGRKDSFSMKLETILDKIKEERKITYNSNYKNLINSLDNNPTQPLNITIKPLKKQDYRRKRLLDALLENINLDFNKIRDIKTPPSKKKNSYHFNRPPPPPPPPSFFSRRKQIYIPPKSNEDIIKDSKEELPAKEKTLVNIERTIDSLEDLLKLIEDYPIKDDIKYNIDMESIHNIKGPLKNLNKMIGMHNLKNNIVDQIIFHTKTSFNRKYQKWRFHAYCYIWTTRNRKNRNSKNNWNYIFRFRRS